MKHVILRAMTFSAAGGVFSLDRNIRRVGGDERVVPVKDVCCRHNTCRSIVMIDISSTDEFLVCIVCYNIVEPHDLMVFCYPSAHTATAAVLEFPGRDVRYGGCPSLPATVCAPDIPGDSRPILSQTLQVRM